MPAAWAGYDLPALAKAGDALLAATPLLRGIFPRVDFTEFNFTRHMLQTLHAVSPEKFGVLVDELRFGSQAEKHELSHLYEAKIKNMGNAGRNGGEYYTPRPLIKAIIKVVAPKIGQTIYDGAAGSAGFLCESFAYLSESKQLTTSEVATLQNKTFYGKEKKSLA